MTNRDKAADPGAGAAIPHARAHLLGIVCGMAAEARALGRWADHPSVRVAVTGARPAEAEAAAARLVAAGAGALLSWGLAGGLDPRLAPGTIVGATAVVTPAGRRIALAPVLQGAVEGTLLGVEGVVLSAAAKAALRAGTGALAVDMETHRVAEVAERLGVRCAAVRAVSDPAGRALPALAAIALDARGRPRIGPVLDALARRPRDLPALMAAARDSRAALAALARAADGALPTLLAR